MMKKICTGLFTRSALVVGLIIALLLATELLAAPGIPLPACDNKCRMRQFVYYKVDQEYYCFQIPICFHCTNATDLCFPKPNDTPNADCIGNPSQIITKKAGMQVNVNCINPNGAHTETVANMPKPNAIAIQWSVWTCFN